MSEFNKGDRVRFRENTFETHESPRGTLGTVTSGSESEGAWVKPDTYHEPLYYYAEEIEAVGYDQHTVSAVLRHLRERGYPIAAEVVEDEFADPKTRTVSVNFQVPEGESVVDYLKDVGIDYDIEEGEV